MIMRARAGIAAGMAYLAGMSALLPPPEKWPVGEEVAALERLHRHDPAAAVQETQRRFSEAEAARDLDRVLALMAWASSGTRRYTRWALPVAENLARRTIVLASSAGRWDCVAWAHRWLDPFLEPLWIVFWHYHAFHVRAIQQSAQANQRAGLEVEPFHHYFLRRHLDAVQGSLPEDGDLTKLDLEAYTERWLEDSYKEAFWGPYAALMKELWRAKLAGRDEEVLTLLAQLLQRAETESELRYVRWVVISAVDWLWWPGAQTLIPTLKQLGERLVSRPDLSDAFAAVEQGCALAWTGQDDVFLDTALWAYSMAEPTVDLRYRQELVLRLDYYHRGQLLTEIGQRGLARASALPVEQWTIRWIGGYLASPHVPTDLRRRGLFSWALASVLRNELCAPWNLYYQIVPETDRPAICLEAAEALLSALALAPDAGHSVANLILSADLHEQAGMPQRAAELRAMAQNLQANEPRSLLQAALASARASAGESKWGEVVTNLEAAVSGARPGGEVLQAALSLQEAYLHLGKLPQAEAWAAKAWELVNTLPISPGERANYLMTMAGLCDLAAQVAETR